MLSGTPYIPETITVHLGTPDSDAPNVTVPFSSYVKNVASSEIFPTWPENALRANIYAITSFALNRIYTEWYRSRGYDFDITATTQYDQKFINGREYFQNISYLVDELFNDYVRRQGKIEPLFTAFCNGTTVTCEGLSQWGTVDLANRGLTPYEILQYYYGDDIDIVKNAPVRTTMPSYPGIDLQFGSAGNDVRSLQIYLNRISGNYPAIPKIPAADGIFDAATEAAVRKFQEVFGLEVTGIVNESTWYRITYIYTSVKRIAELDSEGVRYDEVEKRYTEDLKIGMQSIEVSIVRMNTTIRKKTPEVEIGVVLLTIVDSSEKILILKEDTVFNIFCDKCQILINDTAGTDIHMTDLGISHLSVGKSYCQS